MALAEDIDSFCRQLLRTEEINDPWCSNGIQVPGKKTVNRVGIGVSASAFFLESAAAWKADMVITHHGLFWKSGVKNIDEILGNRLRILMKHDISLLAYHLPLDGHAEFGNNALIAKKLGLQNITMHDICAVGDFSQAVSFSVFLATCATAFKQQPAFSANFSGDTVMRVGICSGGGGEYAETCKKAQADTFVTGEISEHHYHEFRELPINFMACGHYATEKLGIQALGEQLIEAFPGLETFFFEEPCPV